jgi:hypothetical protein
MRKSKSKPVQPPPPIPPFPPSVLGLPFIGRVVTLLSPSTEYCHAYIVAVFMACVSFLMGRDMWMTLGARRVFAVIYVALTGDSAVARKSSAVSDGIALWARPLCPPPSPGSPASASIVEGHGSGEGFMQHLFDVPGKNNQPSVTGRKLLAGLDELAALFKKMSRDQAGALEELFLRMYDAPGHWSRATKGDGTATATNSYGVIIAASTTSWLVGSLKPEMVFNGLLNRFAFFTGEPRAPLAIPPEIDPTVAQGIRDDLTAKIDSVRGKEMKLTLAAEAFYRQAYDQQWGTSSGDAIVDAAGARYSTMAIRFAMIFAALDGAANIEVHHVEAGWDLAEYCRAVATSLVVAMPAATVAEIEDRVLNAAKKLTQAGQKTFKARDINQKVKGHPSITSTEAVVRALEALTVGGELMQVADDTWVVPS